LQIGDVWRFFFPKWSIDTVKESKVPGTECRPSRYRPAQQKMTGVKAERGNRTMWISLFAFACGAAVCLGLAAVMMQSAEQRSLRG
jgi:hypothetical protein